MIKRIFLDLDGPILDVRPRYHAVYCELVIALGGTPLGRQEYWQGKRNRTTETDLARSSGLAGEALQEFSERRAQRIETDESLELDMPWPWSRSTLAELSNHAELVLVTQRSHRDRLLRQLERLDLIAPFAAIVSGRGDNTPSAKYSMIESARLGAADVLAFVGDTEVDLHSAQKLGVPAIAVLTGIRSREHLAAANPDAVLTDLRGLPGWLEQNA
tara:strand:+ start:17480 stop:18127 length:648 start_codon:yes stop_codon:yes gene_type:complete